MQDIVLDNIKFPTGEERDGARFRQIQEERLNRNFRRLQEDADETHKNIDTRLSSVEEYLFANPLKVLYVSPSGVSVSNNSWKTIASFTLEKGIWLVTAFAQFNKNATGIRCAVLSRTQDSDSAIRSMSRDNQVAVNGDLSYCRFVDIYEISSPETFYLNSYQNSGSAITTYGRVYAVRLV